MNCILLSTLFGWYIECKDMHGMVNIQLT